MRFRVKAFAWHLLAGAMLLSLVLLTLWAGWYRWPGWYLTKAVPIAALLAGVDVTLGPLVTFLIANPIKPRRELARDIGIIVLVQLAALGYGSSALWKGRPLYYTFSVDRLEFVQASELDPKDIDRALVENRAFAPHWYSLPRWVWAPLPQDEQEAAAIVNSAAFGAGKDVIQMPRYFKPWEAGKEERRKQCRKLAEQGIFTKAERTVLAARMSAQGFAPDAPTLFLTGRGRPLLAVLDPDTLEIRAILDAQDSLKGMLGLTGY